nr:hypothetical protein [uncultured Marinifilum sp.]
MKEIYTLLKKDVLHSTDEILFLMEKINESNIFESNELISYLDSFNLKASDKSVQKLKLFRQSSCNVNLKIPDIREVLMN